VKQKKTNSKTIETLTHDEAKRKNIPTAEFQSVLQKEAQESLKATYPRDAAGLDDEKQNRNRDLDPQLVWRGKDEQDWSDLVVHVPPLYIQEKVHPKVLIDDLLRRSATDKQAAEMQTDLFADFNGIPTEAAKTDFYQHDQNWSNRMILGDSLQVMASLAEREGLRGKVQCISFDPPYGIKFNSNFQWSTTSRDVKDGNADHITREPEQVKAFRDTWRDGIHSYLTYLRDRLTVARDLLTESGSIFVQIGDENVHRVRAMMDEVFGDENCVAQISFSKTSGQTDARLAGVIDYALWYAKTKAGVKSRKLKLIQKPIRSEKEIGVYVESVNGAVVALTTKHLRGDIPLPEGRVFRSADTTSATGSDNSRWVYTIHGKQFKPSGSRGWSTSKEKMDILNRSGRLLTSGSLLRWKNYHDENPFTDINNSWIDLSPSGFG
jgi:adenine-specific DNA-methyltransferase